MHKKNNVVLVILYLIPIAGAIVSLFMPYLIKLNIRSGDVSLPRMIEGHHFGLGSIILMTMLATLCSFIFFQKLFLTVILSFIGIGCTYLLRHAIHFQGCIDHDYDSKTGAGYKILFAAVIVHFLISLVHFIVNRNQTAHSS